MFRERERERERALHTAGFLCIFFILYLSQCFKAVKLCFTFVNKYSSHTKRKMRLNIVLSIFFLTFCALARAEEADATVETEVEATEELGKIKNHHPLFEFHLVGSSKNPTEESSFFINYLCN